jgi:hypothetical protein
MSLHWKTFRHLNIPFKEIETIEGETRYYKVDENNILPSMTSILKILDDKGIDKWKKAVGDDEANRIVQEAITRGNSLHDLSERYLLNTLNREDVSGPGKILFNRNKKYLDELGPIVGVEVPLYSLCKKYAGRGDLIAFHGKHLCIVDHKNSRKPINLKKRYGKRKLFKYMLQIVGYAIAFKEMFPDLPMPTHGMLIIGNHETMNSECRKFLLKPLIKEFEILLDIYYNHSDKKQSAYFKL